MNPEAAGFGASQMWPCHGSLPFGGPGQSEPKVAWIPMHVGHGTIAEAVGGRSEACRRLNNRKSLPGELLRSATQLLP